MPSRAHSNDVILAYRSSDLSDTTAPLLSTLLVTPNTINTLYGPVTVTVTMYVSDAGSGVQSCDIDFSIAVTNTGAIGSRVTPASNLISGTAQAGVLETKLIFPQFSPNGTWNLLTLSCTDNANNYMSFVSQFTNTTSIKQACPIQSITYVHQTI